VKKKYITMLISALLLFILTAPSYSNGVYILCYHAFLEKKDPYSFTPDQFREQLNKLKSSGFRFVTYEDVINNKISGNKNILISIDDGNKSVYETYYTIMKPMGIKPLLGIYPAIIGKMKYAMTWEEVKKLSDEGCFIASHGYHHMFLSEKYYNEDQANFKKEIYLSKKVLEQKLNRTIDTMVYPFGVNSPIAISELKNAGYKYGLTIVQGRESLPSKDNFQIRRYLMTKTGQKGVVAHIIKNAGAVQTADSSGNSDSTGYSTNSSSSRKLSIINYPGQIKKFMTANVIAPPEKIETGNNKKVKFKPFVHPSKTSSDSKNKNKKVSAENEKKNQRKKKTV
jgi:peptidoglycan/xylan/chitin deacetylase (PgdA/CDA1 family)